MKPDRNQFTLGSLMLLVATVALLLAVPIENWLALRAWMPNIIAMVMLAGVGFGVGLIGCKLFSVIGLTIEESAPRRDESAR